MNLNYSNSNYDFPVSHNIQSYPITTFVSKIEESMVDLFREYHTQYNYITSELKELNELIVDDIKQKESLECHIEDLQEILESSINGQKQILSQVNMRSRKIFKVRFQNNYRVICNNENRQ